MIIVNIIARAAFFEQALGWNLSLNFVELMKQYIRKGIVNKYHSFYGDNIVL